MLNKGCKGKYSSEDWLRLSVSRKTFKIPPQPRKRVQDIPLRDITSRARPEQDIGASDTVGSSFDELKSTGSFVQSGSDPGLSSPWSLADDEGLEEEILAARGGRWEGRRGRQQDLRHRSTASSIEDQERSEKRLSTSDIIVPNPPKKPPSRAFRRFIRIMTVGQSDGAAFGLTGKPLLYVQAVFSILLCPWLIPL